ncbi:putative acetylcholine regulator unc-18 [Caerostris extrusa]|uniref:Acetylcholine regulator unc-18 n=1 Tax=Caerostris extrusa TaxID=172846 RepID=A0AAV4UN93_CAEEX|nr:putative acetylcholine regulator unc-18 [Caerostris extrusa]
MQQDSTCTKMANILFCWKDDSGGFSRIILRITKLHFDQIVKNSGISFTDANAITNILHLDVDILRPGYCNPFDPRVPQYTDNSTIKYKQSRWVPILKHAMLSAIDGTLSQDHFPFLDMNTKNEINLTERRNRYWCVDKKSEHVSRLIVLIVGGVTYSEMRCAYEVMKTYTGWEIFVGGDDILTPNSFIEKLQDLHGFLSYTQ